MVFADKKEPVMVDSGDEEEFNVPHSVPDIMSYKKRLFDVPKYPLFRESTVHKF